MSKTTVWLDKTLRDELIILRVNEGKSSIEQLIKALLENYKEVNNVSSDDEQGSWFYP